MWSKHSQQGKKEQNIEIKLHNSIKFDSEIWNIHILQNALWYLINMMYEIKILNIKLTWHDGEKLISLKKISYCEQ